MRLNLWWLATSPALLALGCAGGPTAPTESTAPAHHPQLALGNPIATPNGLEMALGIYTIEIDRATLTGAITPRATRSVAAAGSDTYELCVSEFFPSPPIKITNIEIDASDLQLDYAVQHPFSAPTNLDAPASASNRADLGISGSCMFLVDGVPGGIPRAVSFFSDEITVAPDLITSPDFYRKGYDGWISISGMTCDTFPSMVLVDESNPDCRTSSSSGTVIHNDNDLAGNYNADSGWQRSTMGPNRDAWTGHGVLHQGQTASSSVSLDLATMDAMASTGGFSLDMVLGALYNDPRGGENAAAKKRNRLPGATGSVDDFFYNMASVSRYHKWVWTSASLSSSASTNFVQLTATATFSDGSSSDVTMDAAWGSHTFVSPPTGTGTYADPLVFSEDIGALPVGTAPGQYDIAARFTCTDTSSRIVLDCALAPSSDQPTSASFYCLLDSSVS